MDKEEIKSMISMQEVAERYGLSVDRHGFARCPFHNDHNNSMKIYPRDRGFNCFVCHTGGDIFRFVMLMDNCDFKTAFEKLGGIYNPDDYKAFKVKKSKHDEIMEEAKSEVTFWRQFVSNCNKIIKKEVPYSEAFVKAINARQTAEVYLAEAEDTYEEKTHCKY